MLCQIIYALGLSCLLVQVVGQVHCLSKYQYSPLWLCVEHSIRAKSPQERNTKCGQKRWLHVSLRAMFCLEFISVCMYVCTHVRMPACFLYVYSTRIQRVYSPCCAKSFMYLLVARCRIQPRRDSVYLVVDL